MPNAAVDLFGTNALVEPHAPIGVTATVPMVGFHIRHLRNRCSFHSNQAFLWTLLVYLMVASPQSQPLPTQHALEGPGPGKQAARPPTPTAMRPEHVPHGAPAAECYKMGLAHLE
ncbi:hypothetical protein GUJ93_ZPchr0013g37572 [Zizania palustris]|uniref:Uncharacterized protein n=1 Tax=Zizania palustris TaxID=103762 RepID=A0A8J5X0I5_ZIZPA|nr:hypothetical protein GUJ93_ZPchr0013g37572 [Zizania palustris]